MFKRLIIIFALVAIVALPFALRPKQAVVEQADDTLVLITPHNEAIRQEFGTGFKTWYKARTGRSVALDWRVLGGTTEIARFLEGEYVASFQNLWERKLGKPWSTDVQASFQAAKLSPDASALAKEARATFLNSEASSGIDLFFGGGTYDFAKQAQAGRLIASELLQKHPKWFSDAVIPRTFAGEEYWDAKGLWYGCVLSSYGIVYNRDSLKRLGITEEPKQWSDLIDPRLMGEVALCDPTKSGSIAKAFENVIQQQMQHRLTALKKKQPNADPKKIEAQAIHEGWLEGLKLLQLVGANSRYFTDSSQKPPIDVAAGNCAVGMCIDFYGRQQDEAVARRALSDRLGYISPSGGSVSSVDPIALLRGAPHRAVAEAFIEYVLSMDGQKLWNLKPGEPGGPQHFALRRLPVRKDFYSDQSLKPLRSDPTDDPFTTRDPLIYRPEWTGGVFREMSFIIRIMCLDTHRELVEARKAVLAAGNPPQAAAALSDLESVGYDKTLTVIKQALGSKNKVDELTLANQLGEGFRQRYKRAIELAKQGK